MTTKTFSTLARLLVMLLIAMLALSLLTFCAASPAPSITPQSPTNSITFIDYAAPELGIVVDASLQIVQVVPGSAAEQGGLQKGDVVKMVNDIKIIHPSNARRAFHARQPSTKTTLIILRGAKEIILEILPAPPGGSPGASTSTPVPADMTYF